MVRKNHLYEKPTVNAKKQALFEVFPGSKPSNENFNNSIELSKWSIKLHQRPRFLSNFLDYKPTSIERIPKIQDEKEAKPSKAKNWRTISQLHLFFYNHTVILDRRNCLTLNKSLTLPINWIKNKNQIVRFICFYYLNWNVV